MKTIRALYAFDPALPPHELIGDCIEWGMNTIILNPDFFDDDHHMRKLLESNNIDLWLNLPVFMNGDYLAFHRDEYAVQSDGKRAENDWSHFVCPSSKEYINTHLINLKDLVKSLNPQYISLDFIRFPIFWEKVDLAADPGDIVDGCYCNRCINEFSRYIKAAVPDNNRAQYIRNCHLREWADWKTDKIFETAEYLINSLKELKPDAEYWINTIPWEDDLQGGIIKSAAGQDVSRLASLVDGVAAMTFSHELNHTLSWKADFLQSLKESTGKKVVTFIQTENLYQDKGISDDQFKAEILESRNGRYAGVCYFCHGQLKGNEDKLKILKDLA